MKDNVIFQIRWPMYFVGDLIQEWQVGWFEILKEPKMSHQTIQNFSASDEVLAHFQRTKHHVLSALFVVTGGHAAEMLKNFEFL
jgi:hypothetical protein